MESLGGVVEEASSWKVVEVGYWEEEVEMRTKTNCWTEVVEV